VFKKQFIQPLVEFQQIVEAWHQTVIISSNSIARGVTRSLTVIPELIVNKFMSDLKLCLAEFGTVENMWTECRPQ